MASHCMYTAQPVSSKLCARKKSFSSTSCSTKNFLPFLVIPNSSSRPSFQLILHNSNHNTRHTRASKVGPESEAKDEKEDDDEEDFQKGSDKDTDVREEDDYKEVFGEDDDDDKEDLRAEDEDNEDLRAEETVLKLYTDIKNQNIDGISEVIGDECQCFSNFCSTLTRQEASDGFLLLANDEAGERYQDYCETNIQRWHDRWCSMATRMGEATNPTGERIQFPHMPYVPGKAVNKVKNVEMFMEPVFHMEHLRLRTIAFAVKLAEKTINYLLRPAENIRRRAVSLLLLALLLLAAAALYFTRQRF